MKTKLCIRWRQIVVSLGFSVVLLNAAHGQSLTNLAGIWNVMYFDTPTGLTEQRNPQGLVTNVPEKNAFQSGEVQVVIQPDGTVVNPSGSLSIGGQGVVNIAIDGNPTISARVNAAEDAMTGITSFESESMQELNLLLKAPATLVTNDLVGTWNLLVFATPAQLVQVLAPTTNGSALTDLVGSDSNSVSGSEFAQIATGTMTFNSNGSLLAMLGDPVTGSFSVGTNGQVSLLINGDEPFTANAMINASKDLIFALHQEPAFNRQEIIMLARQPASLTAADLQGAWKITTFNVPTEIDLTRNSSNFVTDIQPVGEFGINQLAYTEGHDGFVTGILDGEPTIGAVSIGAAGAVSVTLTNSSGSQSHSGYVNAGKNAILLVESDSESYTLVTLMRAPAVPGNRQDFGLILFGPQIYWASGTNRALQVTTDLGGGSWTNVSGTTGQHHFAPTQTNNSGFFRIAE